MNLNLPTGRGRFGRFGSLVPLSGLGACNPMPGSTFCLDENTGSVVDCKSAACAAPAGGGGASPGWSTNAPSQSTSPSYANIPIGGFTGDFQVETLDSYLAGRLAAKESPFIANTIAQGADSVDAEANDFLPTAQSYCSINSALPDCSPASQAQLAAKYAALYRAWAGSQQAGTYQSADKGTLSAPVNALTNVAPTYTPPPTVAQTNVLAPPQTGNPTAGNQNVTSPATQPASTSTSSPDAITQWLQANWVLVAAAVGGLILLPQLMGKK